MARDDILIQIRADIKDIKTKLNVIHGDFSKMTKGVGKETDKLKGKFSGLKTMIVGAFTIGTLYAFKRGMQECVKVASNLEEQTAKFGTVFKGVMDIANEAVETLTESYGMSTREARELMAGTQDMLVPMGMARDEAAGLSFEIVKLATDIGSFNNLPTAQAMEKIKSALVGMYRPMRSVGVVLSAVTVEQKALNMGLADSSEEVTALDKAVAAYTLSLEMSKDAQGDFIRTSDGFANSVKIMNAEVEELKSTIGIKLLPILSDWIGDFSDLTKEVTKFLEKIGVLTKDDLPALIQLQAKYTRVIERRKHYMDKEDEGLIKYRKLLIEVEKQIEALLEKRREHKVAIDEETEAVINLTAAEIEAMPVLKTKAEEMLADYKKYLSDYAEYRKELSEKMKPFEEDVDKINLKFGEGVIEIDKLTDSFTNVDMAVGQFATSAGQAFGNAIRAGGEFDDMLKEIMKSAIQLALSFMLPGPIGGFFGGIFGGMLGAPSPGLVNQHPTSYAPRITTMGQMKEAGTLSKPMFGRRFLEESMKQNLNLESVSTWSLEGILE